MVARGFYVLIVSFVLTMCIALSGGIALAQYDNDGEFTTDFLLEDCTFDNDDSERANPYFSLDPGYPLVLEGQKDDEDILVVVTVHDSTKAIDLE